jgi:superfamily II DNA or RNA helicase
MKEQALKETESKMVVIATYAMAAEALDIKTLTTLIMATPKTDIEQSVGRILREKHSSPIVVDIVDSHNTFKNQWRKRKTFYKKENYKIIYTTSPEYNPDTSVNSWTLVFNPVSKDFIKKDFKKNISVKSNSSSDRSIADDSDDEVEVELEEGPKDKYAPGVCLLKIKK